VAGTADLMRTSVTLSSAARRARSIDSPMAVSSPMVIETASLTPGHSPAKVASFQIENDEETVGWQTKGSRRMD
jgi:hypothetical protein